MHLNKFKNVARRRFHFKGISEVFYRRFTIKNCKVFSKNYDKLPLIMVRGFNINFFMANFVYMTNDPLQ